MTYQETLDYLYGHLPMFQRIGKAAYKADLATTIALDKYFGHPHARFKTIHVAGTNGKGSVSHMLAAVLQEAGFKTGLYTSPHLLDFRERIRINGEKVNEKYVIDFVNRHQNIFEKLSPSFFEMTVAMAFEYFASEKADIAVIETGMGGRLDSTNIINPLVSVITNIGMDHTEFLGDSLALIAKEKAGIIKSGIPVVIGELQEEVKEVFKEFAKEQASELTFASEIYRCDYALLTQRGLQSLYVSREGKPVCEKLETDLLGFYQQKNVLTVLQVIKVLNNSGMEISTENIYRGLKHAGKNTGLLGRWQIIGNNPKIVCDTAHNSEGIKMVLSQIRSTPHKKLHMVIGFVSDKNISKILGSFPEDAAYYFTMASIPRALDHRRLKSMAKGAGLKGKSYDTVEKAVNAAKKQAGADDLIFIGGSTFVVAEIIS
ncbi:MAG: bifunctional folylpolyglutamate synthase/dihydrofolate synthase [Bacteroidales bacterium]